MKKKIIIAFACLASLVACKRGRYEVADTGQSSAADSVASDTAVDARPKLVKTAQMRLKVKNVQQTGDSISLLTAGYHGMVIHRQITSNEVNSQDVRLSTDSLLRVAAFSTTGDMRVKIPSQYIDEFMGKVSRMGLYVTSRQMDNEDKSLDYLSARLKLKNRLELVARHKKGKIKIKDPEAVLWLKDDMVDEQIDNQKINDAVEYSIVGLNFYQSNTIVKEMIANDDPSRYQLPFFKCLLIALTNGWYIFTGVILWIANLWVLALAAVGGFMVYKVYKRKYAPLKTLS